jgi:ATP-binding cassette, subfamily B, bacterial PglK
MRYFRSILYLISKKDKKKIPGLIALFLILSFFEVVGIGLIAPYIALLTNTESETLYRFFIFLGLPTDNTLLIYYTSIGLLSVFLIKSIIVILINKIIIFFSVAQRVNLSAFLMKAYQSLPYEEFLIRNSSEYIHNIQALTSRLSVVLILLLRAVSDLLIGLSIFVLLAWQNFKVLAILTSIIMIFLLTYDIWFKDKVKKYGENVNNSADLMIKDLNEGIKGLKEIRVLGRESYFYKRFVRSITSHAHNSGTFTFVTAAPRYLLEFILVFFIVSIVLSSILLGESLNDIVPTLALFGVASLRLLPLSNTLLQTLLQLRNNENSIDRLYKDVYKFKQKNLKKNETRAAEDLVSFQSLELKNINFSYSESNYKSLNNISIKIEHGKSIGIIGKSGSGKTTLIDLLLGLLEPNTGEIYFNNINCTNDREGIFDTRVAYIPQQVFLLDDSLMNNISLNNKNDTNHDLVMAAVKQARLMELVERLPNGLDTRIGESGVLVSGGERQRIALARALYYDRDVIIMDEATSALDNETEKEIISEIKSFKGSKTLIVIAHRLTTLQNCDIIYQLEKGKIVASGNYKEMVIDNNK